MIRITVVQQGETVWIKHVPAWAEAYAYAKILRLYSCYEKALIKMKWISSEEW